MLEVALISFAVLLVTWIVAPEGPRAARTPEPKVSPSAVAARA